jgi:hypothetical protein
MTTIDPEAIARVLDGSATPEERARVLAQADESPELLELLADSAAVMNESVTAPGVVPIDSRRTKRLPAWLWSAMAAALVIAIAIPVVWPHHEELGPFPILAIADEQAVNAARAGAAIPSLRGAASERVPQSVIAGAKVVDYMTLEADTAQATLAIEIAAALRAIPGGTAAAGQVQRASRLTPEIMRSIEQVVDVRAFRAAGWAELARLAAIADDTEALGRDDLRAAMKSMASDPALGEETRTLAGQLREAIGSDRMVTERVERLATDLLFSLGS